MILLARGSVTDPGALGPYMDDEMRVVADLKADSVVKAIYRRVAGLGVPHPRGSQPRPGS